MAGKEDGKGKKDGDGKEDGKGDDKKDGKGKEDGDGDDKGKEDDKKDGDGKKDCKDQNSCVGRDASKKLSVPVNSFKSIDQMAKDKLHSTLKKIWGALHDKAKFLSLVTKELPKVLPNMIDKIGNSTAGAFDNVSISIKNLFDQVSGQEIKGYPDIFGPFEVAYAIIILKIQNIINQIALGKDADKILADPNIKSDELLDKMIRISKRYKDVVQQAEFRHVFGEWMKNYVDALLKTLDIAQPEIDRINQRLKDIIEGMGDNIGKSITHSLVNVISAIVSNIPVVGGVWSVLLSADELGQEIINGCRPLTKAAGSTAYVIDGVNNQIGKTKCKVNELAKKIEPILSKMTPQTGGGIRKRNALEKKINNTTRRINYMLTRFKCKNKSKPNYTRRIMNRRR